MKRLTLGLIALACAIAAPHLARAQATCPPDARRRANGVSSGS